MILMLYLPTVERAQVINHFCHFAVVDVSNVTILLLVALRDVLISWHLDVTSNLHVYV